MAQLQAAASPLCLVPSAIAPRRAGLDRRPSLQRLAASRKSARAVRNLRGGLLGVVANTALTRLIRLLRRWRKGLRVESRGQGNRPQSQQQRHAARVDHGRSALAQQQQQPPGPRVVEISSEKNEAYRALQRLAKRRAYRAQVGRFLAEGTTFLRMRPRAVVVRRKEWLKRGDDFLEALAAGGEEGTAPTPGEPVPWSAGVLSDDGTADAEAVVCILENRLFDRTLTGSWHGAEGVLSVFTMPEAGRDAGLQGTVVVLDGLRDPLNVGSILRTMEAFGAGTLVLVKSSVDVYSQKAVRSSMGAVVRGRIHCVLAEDAAELQRLLAGYRVFAVTSDTTAHKATPLVDPVQLAGCLEERNAFIFGSERHGVSQEALALADVRVHVPMAQGVESLNVSAAASIVLYSTTT